MLPLTALTTLLGSIIMIGAWAIINHRLHRTHNKASRQAMLLSQFLLHMSIFFVFMFLPHIWLKIDSGQFPLYMAWGYVIGHIFMYLAFLNVGRLFISIVPRFSDKDKPFWITGLVATSIITIINAVTMVWGTRPEFDYQQQVTLFHAHLSVGVGIAIFALICVVPTAILMIRNGFINANSRTRSFLLGTGLLLLMIGGPLHDNANTAGLYIVADILSIVAQLLIAGGVAYRIEERIVVANTVSPSVG